jgi:MTH538 TIR-like domain (DUF1863)
MALKRAFISFDYDNDFFLKEALVGQSKHPDSPFNIADHSIKVASSDWREKARIRIRGCDIVIVICGQHTARASGVAEELEIAREERVPYVLLAGHGEVKVFAPTSALESDKIYVWTWANLKRLVGGER